MPRVIGKISGRVLAQLHSQVRFASIAQASSEQDGTEKVDPAYAQHTRRDHEEL
jgi:hypothetical protein